MRVTDPRAKELKTLEITARLANKNEKYDDKRSWQLNGRRGKFALNYVLTIYNNDKITPVEWMKRHRDFEDLKFCIFTIKYELTKKDGKTRTCWVKINLREEGNKDFLRAKSGRFVVVPQIDDDNDKVYQGHIKVDENAWDEETTKA